MLADVTPSPSPTPTLPDAAEALPGWLLLSLLVLVAAVIVAMFGLTFYNLSAPRSTLKNILGLRRKSLFTGIPDTSRKAALQTLSRADTPSSDSQTTSHFIETLGMSAKVGKRTTRTTLAVAGFSLLGVVIVGVFGLSGAAVRDLRSQVVASITTLVAAIAGFYFGSQQAGGTDTTGTPNNSNASPDDGRPTSRAGVPALLLSITVTPEDPGIASGESLQFVATGMGSDKSTVDLTGTVSWSSSDTAVATITTGGLAAGVSVGTSTITATLGPIVASTTLTVEA